MNLRARLCLPEPIIDVDLTVQDGSTLAMLGANGAGKTTVLNLLAGLVRAGERRIELGDRTLEGGGVSVPPHRRSIAMLTQQPSLFPHLTARQNVAFGLASSKLSRDKVRARTDEWLRRVDATELADRKPAQLSGGQAGRVALARALAVEPALLLLDEPFAALDVDVAARMRTLLRAELAGRTCILVTHDIADVVSLADAALVLGGGRIIDHGPVRRVLANPATDFVARLAGLNLIGGFVTDSDTLAADGLVLHGLAAEPLPSGARAMAAFTPAAVAVYRDAPQGSPRNMIQARVRDIAPSGDRARLTAITAGDMEIAVDLTWPAVTELALVADDRITLSLKATEVTLYPARSGTS